MEKNYMSFIIFDLNSKWRSQTESQRLEDKKKFLDIVDKYSDIEIYFYNMTGLKNSSDLMMWIMSPSPELTQKMISELLLTNLGTNLKIKNTLFSIIRRSVYVKKPDTQQQAAGAPDRKKFFIVYPFTKTIDWYFLSMEERQKMMNEHIVVGKKFKTVRQILGYSFGVDDQEFVVSYETDVLEDFQDLVKALRESQARKYTLNDTPIFVGIYNTAQGALDVLG